MRQVPVYFRYCPHSILTIFVSVYICRFLLQVAEALTGYTISTGKCFHL